VYFAIHQLSKAEFCIFRLVSSDMLQKMTWCIILVCRADAVHAMFSNCTVW